MKQKTNKRQGTEWNDIDPDSRDKLKLAGYLNIAFAIFYFLEWVTYVGINDLNPFDFKNFFVGRDAFHEVYNYLIPVIMLLIAISGIFLLRTKAWWLAFSANLAGLVVLAFQLFITYEFFHHWYGEYVTRYIGLSPNLFLYGGFLIGTGALALIISANSHWPRLVRLFTSIGAIILIGGAAVVSILLRFQVMTAGIE
jgi:hypothetical protein